MISIMGLLDLPEKLHFWQICYHVTYLDSGEPDWPVPSEQTLGDGEVGPDMWTG